ncbi:GmrSD restriction endonuclease domain-containing protein [Dermabacteraceae bacterium P13136]
MNPLRKLSPAVDRYRALPTGKRRGVAAGGGCCGCITIPLLLFFLLAVIAAIVSPSKTETPTVKPVAVEQPQSDASQPAAPQSDAPKETSAPPSEEPPSKEPPSKEPSNREPEKLALPGQLAQLEVKERAPKTGYDRKKFGWRQDTDGNGCDTRNDVFRRDFTNSTVKAGTGGCIILGGTFTSSYSGQTLQFDRAANNIDVDHMVALSDAWQTGANTWDDAKRRQFANDPLNLIATEAALNRQKGASDAATWLPPNKAYRCEYVARQVAVKEKYGLWVKPAEKDAIENVLNGCEVKIFTKPVDWPAKGGGREVLGKPTPMPAPARPEKTQAPVTPKPSPVPAPKKEERRPRKPAPEPKKPVQRSHFKNCREAWDAGAAPLLRGEPGYSSKLDGDRDGVACEKRPK